MLHGHGDDWYKYDFPILHNFSSNVWHGGIKESLLKVVQQHVSGIGKYPDPNAESLAVLAANHHGISQENCLFTNGATEAFYLISHLYSKKAATIFAPTFAEYEDSCRIHGLEMHFADRAKLLSAKLTTSLAFICNPNNPDGLVNTKEEVHELVNRYPKITFVIDEAYIDFAQQAESCVSLLKDYPNVILVKSLTKLFCIPGLRIGYILCNSEVKQRLQERKMPWSVNSLAIEAAKYIFTHYDELKPDVKLALNESKALQNRINSINKLSVVSSDTTYFLVKVEEGTAMDLKEYLVRRHKVLVRDATNFRSLEGEHIRIATQSKEQNEVLIAALTEWSTS